MFQSLVLCLTLWCLAAVLFGDQPATAADGQYTYTFETGNLKRDKSPGAAHLWLPPDVKVVRGLLFAGQTMLEARICRDPKIRQALADKEMGVLFFDPALDAVFDYVKRDSAQRLEKYLADFAVKTGHPEIEFVPFITVGHSTGGIFCRNVAYWKPERVIGVVHVMSGNFQQVPDASRTLAGVPLLAINGEFEEYGPAGGDAGAGLRSEYSLNPDDKKKLNQTQWIMVRMQLLDRRRKNPDNLMSLVVHRGKSHTSWSEQASDIVAQFVRSAAQARLPAEKPDGKTLVRCRPLKAQDGWLSDVDLKDPKFEPAPFNAYKGDKNLAFWHLDKAMAELLREYHQPPWTVPDPTAGQPVEKRFYPPAMLRDTVDTPAAQKAAP